MYQQPLKSQVMCYLTFIEKTFRNETPCILHEQKYRYYKHINQPILKMSNKKN